MAVAFAGMACGVLWPRHTVFLGAYAVHGMMIILFMSFLRMDFTSLLRLRPGDLAEVAFWVMVKLALLPAVMWAITWLLLPDYALPVLLLCGVATGVTAPFFAGVLGADLGRVLQLTVVSSLLVPFTLPALLKLLAGAEVSVSFVDMARMLALVIFLPLGLALMIRRLWPRLAQTVLNIQFPVSVTLFGLINMGIFAGYAGFFREHLDQVGGITLLSMGLVVVSVGGGALLGATSRHFSGLTGAVGLTFINNVLALVFGADFFGPRAALLAAMYMLPIFLSLIPLRWLAQATGALGR